MGTPVAYHHMQTYRTMSIRLPLTPVVLLVLRDGLQVTLGSPEAERPAAYLQARLPAAR
jgi:hypothetical protein